MDTSAVASFWKWFSHNAPVLARLYASGGFETVCSMINEQIRKVGPDLSWEITPGEHARYRFTLTHRPGGPTPEQFAREVAAFAPPDVAGWEFFFSMKDPVSERAQAARRDAVSPTPKAPVRK